MGAAALIGGGALLTAGGAVGGGFLERSQQPQVPSLYEMLSKVAAALYGGSGGAETKKAGRLRAMDPADLTDNQKKWLDEFDIKQKQPGFLDRGLAANKEFQGQFDQQVYDRYLSNIPRTAQAGIDIYNRAAPLATQAYEQQKGMSPEFFNPRTQLSNQLASNMNRGLSPEQTAWYDERLAAGPSNHGESPSSWFSNKSRALSLMGLDMQQRQQNIGNEQNFLNSFRLPEAYPIPNINLATVGAMQGPVPGALEMPGFKDLLGVQGGLSAANYAQGMTNAAALGQSVASGTGAIGGAMGGMSGGGGGGGYDPFAGMNLKMSYPQPNPPGWAQAQFS